MNKYRKKPVEIEAFRFDGTLSILEWLQPYAQGKGVSIKDSILLIETLEGLMVAQIGDYVIRGIEGEFYPCKPSIFHKTYDHM